MNSQVGDRVASLTEEIGGARTRLSILRDALAERRSVAYDLGLRALTAEIPLADREHQAALQNLRELEQQVGQQERRLRSLRREREALLARLSTDRAGAGAPKTARRADLVERWWGE